jgi:DNA-binding CsgD family transcriptional regulator
MTSPERGTVPAEATARRIRELLACGVTIGEIAAAAGRPPGVVALLTSLHWVSDATARAVEDADRLLMGDSPPPGEADEVVIQRLAAGGYDGPATIAERREAVRVLDGQRLGTAEIAARLGTTPRTARRDRARIRRDGRP